MSERFTLFTERAVRPDLHRLSSDDAGTYIPRLSRYAADVIYKEDTAAF